MQLQLHLMQLQAKLKSATGALDAAAGALPLSLAAALPPGMSCDLLASAVVNGDPMPDGSGGPLLTYCSPNAPLSLLT